MIEAKLDKETIDILLQGRAICNKAHIERLMADIKTMNLIHISLTSSLKELGFEEVLEFMQFNDKMCLLLIQEYRTPFIGCDMCKGYREVPPCSAFWMSYDSCFDSNIVTTEERAAKDMLAMYKAGNKCLSLEDGFLELITEEGVRKVHIKDKKISQCPNMQNYYKWDTLDSDLPFEIGWIY